MVQSMTDQFSASFLIVSLYVCISVQVFVSQKIFLAAFGKLLPFSLSLFITVQYQGSAELETDGWICIRKVPLPISVLALDTLSNESRYVAE